MGRLGRIAEAFDKAPNRVKDCESSGSEHSMMRDLSDLVNSYIEKGSGLVDSDFDMKVNDECNCDGIDDDMEEIQKSLKTLVQTKKCDDFVRNNLVFEVEKAWRSVTDDYSSPRAQGSKRLLMARLRDRGHLDAGLCKSKWEKKGRLISGDYQYVDVYVAGTRYIITVSLSQEFETARANGSYKSLLEIMPEISVWKVEEMKELVRIMCRAVKKTMNQTKMAVPPWKRCEYFQAKWFGSYKRTTNELSTKDTSDLNVNEKKIQGFSWTPDIFSCRRTEDFARKGFGVKTSNLTMIMNGVS